MGQCQTGEQRDGSERREQKMPRTRVTDGEVHAEGGGERGHAGAEAHELQVFGHKGVADPDPQDGEPAGRGCRRTEE